MLTDPHSLTTLILAKEQKLKSGKHKMNEANRQFIDKFIQFNIKKDWMESKDYTKLGKILASAVFIGSEINGEPLRGEGIDRMGVHLYDNIIFLKVEQQFHLREREYLPSNADAERKKLRDTLVSRIERLAPLVNHFESMKTRLTKNGKLPKEEAERRRREMIKGTLDKKLAKVLGEIKEEWIKIVYRYELEWFNRMATNASDFINEINSVITQAASLKTKPTYSQEQAGRLGSLKFNRVVVDTPDGFIWTNTTEEFEKMSKQRAEDEGESFYFKMADKLGGLVTGKHQLIDASHSADSSTPFSSFLHFKFEGNTQLSLENKIIVNRSPLNNDFYQYPCTFYNVIINGEKLKNVSEFTVKQAFIKENQK